MNSMDSRLTASMEDYMEMIYRLSQDNGCLLYTSEIKLFGLDNIRDEKEIKQQIGVVFDESCFHDTLSLKNISSIMGNIYSNWDDRLFDSCCICCPLCWICSSS